MKNVTFLKIASLFIFLLSAQTSFGQSALSLPQSHDFNSGQESWISGGSKAQLLDVTQLENQGWNTNGTNFIDYNNNSCNNLTGNVFVLRGSNSTDRILTSPSYAMSGYDSVIFDYDYFVSSMDSSTEGWNLDYSNDSGSTWTTVESYRKNTDFDNLDCGPNDYGIKEVVILDDATYSFTDQSKFRMYTERDGGGNTGSWDYLVIDNVTITGIITSTCSASGTILMERYDGISGTAISDLTGSANYPENPSSDAQLTSFEIPTDVAGNYGAKVSGYICAPQTGYYTFWIASDDNGQLNLSTDDDPANKTTIATVASWTSSRQWDKYTTQKSDRILLVMGESYYVEALMKEGSGGDNLAVGWAKPGEATTAPSQVIPGSVLSPAVSNYLGTDILFYEDQADASQSGSTISGSGTSATNASGITWTMYDPGGDVRVHQGDHIHCSKLDGDTVTWETGDIIISGYTNLNFTVFARKIEDFGSSDYIKLQYSIDGGTTRVNIATYNTNLTNANIGGDINTLTSTTVAGDTLKIYIEVYIDDDDQKFEWEDITLTGIPFYNVWQGTESDLVTNTAKWSKGSQPTAASNVWIPNTKHLKLTDDQEYNTVNARATSQLTIEKTGSLKTVGDFTKIAGTGTVTLNSDATEFASIVVEGTATGEITYNKYINYLAYQEWDLVGSPVLNQNMQSFAQTHTNNNNTNNTGSLAFDDPYYALGEYLTEWGSFSNYTTSTIPNSSFPAGKGYQMATNPTGSGNDMEGQTLAFTGEIATASQSINVQNQNGANNNNGRRWNLVSNPYPSYLKANEIADGGVGNVNNFISQNLSIMDQSFGGVYGWKADGSGYKAYNLANLSDQGIPEALLIAPGQGFMIAASSTDIASLQFTPAMRSVVGGDDFISGAPMLLNHFLKLQLFNGSSQKGETSFFFQPNLTLGLNPGYDAGNLDQNTTLSSRLVQDDQGVNLEINAMDIESLYNQTIPLVINQQEGQSFRISISNNTLPEDINVYLEDVFNGTLTSLKDQDFELVAQEDLSQDGRFYIRFTTESLAINDVLSPSSINVFKLNTDNFITIKGLSPEMGKTSAALYNMLGMKVAAKALNSNTSTQTISTHGLASGVYIITLTAGEQAISKKVIIQ